MKVEVTYTIDIKDKNIYKSIDNYYLWAQNFESMKEAIIGQWMRKIYHDFGACVPDSVEEKIREIVSNYMEENKNRIYDKRGWAR